MARRNPDRPAEGRQVRGDRTRDMLIDETVRCIREEGFSAASARHIIERAGVTWGVIQHHFGDRDGLLTAVIDSAVDELVAALEELATSNLPLDTLAMVEGTWAAFATPKAMAGIEILTATKALRTELANRHVTRLATALEVLRARLDIGDDGRHAEAAEMLLWTTPVAMMIANMFATEPLDVSTAQNAVARLIDRDRDSARR